MSLVPFDKEWPIFQGTRNFFESPFGHDMMGWGGSSSPSSATAMSPWRDFVTPFREMEKQMRELDRQFAEMSRQMSRQMPQQMPLNYAAMQSVFNQDPIVVDSDGKRKYRLNFDLRQFKPEEIHLKTKDNMLSVHAKHESNSESGKLYREFQQNFSIPPEIQLQSMTSVLSPDGILTVEAPLPVTYKPRDALPQQKKEVPIAIEHH